MKDEKLAADEVRRQLQHESSSHKSNLVEVALSDGNPASGDPGRLQQVVRDLLSNEETS